MPLITGIEEIERERIRRLPYREFLKTDFWLLVRDEVYERAGRRCELCFSKSRLNAHHKTYQHHGWEDQFLDELVCLCSDCHAKFHDKLAKAESEEFVEITLRDGRLDEYLCRFPYYFWCNGQITRVIQETEEYFALPRNSLAQVEMARKKWYELDRNGKEECERNLEWLLLNAVMLPLQHPIPFRVFPLGPGDHVNRHKYRVRSDEVFQAFLLMEEEYGPLHSLPGIIKTASTLVGMTITATRYAAKELELFGRLQFCGSYSQVKYAISEGGH